MPPLYKPNRTLVAIAIFVVLCCAYALIHGTPAHAEGGKGPSDKTNVIMTLDLKYGLISTSTQLFTEKGPMDCNIRCGRIVARFNAAGVFVSASVKLKPYEKLTSASYYYSSFDGSGDYDGQGNWNGRGTLPATKLHTDAQGIEHTLYLTSAVVTVYNKKPTVKKGGLVGSAAPGPDCQQSLCGTASPGA